MDVVTGPEPGPPGQSGDVDSVAISVVTGALRRIAELLPPDRLLALAICDADGTPTDLAVRDPQGHVAVIAGVPEDRRPDLAQLLALAAGEIDLGPAGRAGAFALSAPSTLDRPDDIHRTIVEESPLPLMLLDAHHSIVFASPSVPYELGWSRAELLGYSFLDFLHPDDRDRAANMLAGGPASRRFGTVLALRWRRRRHGYVAVEAALRPVDSHTGELGEGAVIALRTNPLQWTGLGETLVAKEHQRALADRADSGLAMVSATGANFGAVLEANAPFGRLAGTTRAQLAGLSLFSLFSDDEAEYLRKALQHVVGGQPSTTVEATLLPKLGQPRPITITVMPSPLADHASEELVVRLQDMTEQVELIEQLTRTIDNLERSNEELAGLARITAHDLAAPLRALSGLIDLLPQGDANADTLLTLDAIRSAIDRMQAMVGGVIGYVQVRSERPARTHVDLSDLLARVRETLEADVLERRAVVVSEELPTVYGDEHQLERVLQNLVANALKYSPDDSPQIRVSAQREPGAWRISVADQGIGIAEPDRDRIFDLFERAGTDAGSGIGLATCRRIIEQHGGRIWVEPNEPTGSVFSFTIPDEPTIASG
jgi:PAS domain S-box-containing protein